MERDKKKKVSFLFMSRHIKMIQDTLLYNKIECYNKGVQRSPSRSVKGCTHSLKYLHHSRAKMFRRTSKKGSAFPLLDYISVETIGCWSHHDAWCKHWRSSPLTENNGVSWVEMQKNILILPDQLVWAIILRWWTSPPPESHLMNMDFSSMSLLG